MTKRVVSGMDEQVATWVAARIGGVDFTGSPSTAIGLIDDRGYLVAGVVYTTYTVNDIVMHVALLTPRSLTRRFVEEGFKYPLVQLGCARVSAMVSAGNQRSHRFVERLGFTEEGRLREWYQDGQDAVIYGMLRRECRWIHPRRKFDGQSITPGARASGLTLSRRKPHRNATPSRGSAPGGAGHGTGGNPAAR